MQFDLSRKEKNVFHCISLLCSIFILTFSLILKSLKVFQRKCFKKFFSIHQGFHPILLAKFPDFPWLFRSQVPLLSLTLARNKLQVSQTFPKSRFKKFILLKMYAYHKALFTFQINFSTPTWCQMNVLQFYTNLDEHSWKHWLT